MYCLGFSKIANNTVKRMKSCRTCAKCLHSLILAHLIKNLLHIPNSIFDALISESKLSITNKDQTNSFSESKLLAWHQFCIISFKYCCILRFVLLLENFKDKLFDVEAQVNNLLVYLVVYYTGLCLQISNYYYK